MFVRYNKYLLLNWPIFVYKINGNESRLKQSLIESNIMDIIAVDQNNNLESSFNNLLEFIGA